MESWLNDVNAVLDVWYPGEAGGEAIAALLIGKVNPSGKLPVTFPRTEGQLPLVYNHKPTGRGDDYNDGSGQALFPFGYGLSYTTFDYTELTVDRSVAGTGDTITLSCKIKNTGDRDGEEVVQLYIYDELATVARPVKELKAFQRVVLKAGESQSIIFRITPEMLTMLNEQLLPVVEPGFFRIMVGSSSKDIRLRTRIEIQ
jgi:beta-glucosidase